MKLTTLIFMLLFTASFLFGQQSEFLTKADQMPYFSGCEDEINGSKEKQNCSNTKLIHFISQNLQYPAKAKVESIEGTVYVSFIVTEKGAIIEPTVLHDIGGNCAAEALRVVKMMPPFEPGIQDGKHVHVKLNLPIQFKLQSLEENKASEYNLAWGALKSGKVTRTQLKENLSNSIQVRNRNGDEILINQLIFSYEKGKRVLVQKSRGEITKELSKVAEKAKKGGIFTVSVSVQESGEFIYIDKIFEVVE